MADSKKLLKQFESEYGSDKIVQQGVELEDVERLPTGVFPFDLASGGGFPKGRISIIWGAESSLKTTLALKAIANYQRSHPDMRAVFVDAEHSYDPSWGKKLGVNNDELIFVQPDHGEQAVDITDALLEAEDVGLVVFDSLAALITTRESENSSEKANVGGSGLLASSLYRRVVQSIARQRREGRAPALILINQVRMKIGVLYGSPETMPGGQAFKFASAMTVRVYGKDEIDKKLSGNLPAWKKVTGQIQKWKVPIVNRAFEFQMAAIDLPSKKLDVGDVDDWNMIKKLLQDYGALYKDKTNWVIFDQTCSNLEECKAVVYEDPEYTAQVRSALIEHLSQEVTGEEEGPLNG